MTQDDKQPREEKREWMKPEVRRIRAGSAESNANTGGDGSALS